MVLSGLWFKGIIFWCSIGVMRSAVNRGEVGSTPSARADMEKPFSKYKEKECNIHGLTSHRHVKGRKNSYICKKCANAYVSQYRRKIKEKALAYKGGKCERCGYNKSNWFLTFHHLDPNEKDFALGKYGHARSWKKVKEELEKCQLLCLNCHGEVHEQIEYENSNSSVYFTGEAVNP